MLRVAGQDRAAFKQLYDATSRRLFGLALRMLKRRDVAEDVLQDAFVRIWQHAGRYDPDRGAPMPWLWRILRNAAIDRLRRDQADHADIDDFAERLSAPEAPLDARIDLSGGLGKLGAKKSHALSLAFVEGYTHEEIAEELAAPLGTVKSQLRRSLEQLRRHLEETPAVARA
nr:sigma-70 family RNA polymerase sigma factor [Phenylobacterium aquaticum]